MFWRNLGFPAGYPQTGNGYAYGCWTLRKNINAGNQFDLIDLLPLVKKGDVVVLDQGRFAGDTTGHIAFADEDYNGTSMLRLMGQNQEHASGTVGYKVTIDNVSVVKFLGAFRYKGWNNTPPTPTPTENDKKHFPWFIINQRRRNML